jgi:AcrR family transcriptional regulator
MADLQIRPLRADAARNRAKIVCAAREAFAEGGLEAQIDDVARRAGVGVGTVYRHFPAKDDLVRALIEAKMERMVEHGRAALAAHATDPWAALGAFIDECAEEHITDLGLAQVVSTQPSESFAQAARDVGLTDVATDLIERARAAGAVRADAGMLDIPLLMCSLGSVTRAFGPAAARRFLRLALDGLRATDAEPLPALAPEELPAPLVQGR